MVILLQSKTNQKRNENDRVERNSKKLILNMWETFTNYTQLKFSASLCFFPRWFDKLVKFGLFLHALCLMQALS